MLRIFGREAWLCDAEGGPSSLTVSLESDTTRLRLLAQWNGPVPVAAIEAYVRKGGSNSETEALRFFPCGDGFFARHEVSNGGGAGLQLWAYDPPDRIEIMQLAGPVFSAAASLLPACADASVAPGAGEPVDFVSLVNERLREDGVPGALKLFTYARSNGDGDEVIAAAREILIHLARYPLDRDPLLGAFLACLCGEAARK